MGRLYLSCMNRGLLTLPVAAVVAFVAGCADVQFKGERAAGDAALAAEAWPFVPVTLRLHPFTTLTPATDKTPAVLEARIDRFIADSGKGPYAE